MDDKKIRLAIIDDDPQMVELMKNRILVMDAIELVGTASDAEKGIALINANQVDAVIIDLVMPGHDGFYLLEQLNHMRPNRPICVVVSSLNATHAVSRASALGADHFMIKPFDMDLLFRRILEIDRYKSQGVYEGRPPTVRVDDFIQAILDGLPLSHALMGYRYIKTAVRMAIEDPTLLDGLTKRLYPEVAKEHKSTASRVERAIRHAIHTVWQREGGPARFAQMMGFPLEENKPTNGHFIASIVARYRYSHPEEEKQKGQDR